MTIRTKVISAFLAAIAFVLTPSPLTQGQANSTARSHVDQSILNPGDGRAVRSELDRVDSYALGEVDRIARQTRTR